MKKCPRLSHLYWSIVIDETVLSRASCNTLGLRVVHKLRWQVFGFFWLLTYPRWDFLSYKRWQSWQKVTFYGLPSTYPPPLVNVVCERPYNTFLSNLSGNQTDWKQKQWDCLKMRIFQNPFCQLFFRWVLTLLSDSYNKFLSLIKNCVRQEKILKWEISSLFWFIMLINSKSIACLF